MYAHKQNDKIIMFLFPFFVRFDNKLLFSTFIDDSILVDSIFSVFQVEERCSHFVHNCFD